MGDRTWVDIEVYVGDHDKMIDSFEDMDPDKVEDFFEFYNLQEYNNGAYDERFSLSKMCATFEGRHGAGGDYGPFCFACFRGYEADVPSNWEGFPSLEYNADRTVDTSNADRYWDIKRLIELWKKSGCTDIIPENDDDKRILAAYAAWKLRGGTPE